MSGLYRALRPLLFRLDPELAHRLAITVGKSGWLPGGRALADPALRVSVLGLDFPNPVGLAAGFDKNAEAADAMLAQGFGFVEVGSLTPLPQPGNPAPRLFRLTEDRAIINRLGFNNQGYEQARRRLERRGGKGGIVGVNIGAGRDAADPVADYVAGIKALNEVADYLTVNISSPNTAGLRSLQARPRLEELIDRLSEARAKLKKTQPFLIKIAPDLDDGALEDISVVALRGGIDGIVVSNTTVFRPSLKSANAGESGGLSGRPLFELSTRKLARLFALTSGKLPLIGVGGIDSAETAFEKFRAGASLVQLYSGMVYKGPGIARDLSRALSHRLRRQGVDHVSRLTGSG
ncbi:MAG: quinone-dependent dihydroorotate dehydrogenase, partial [Pseudomonadota bacterium]|nr:quinone-dependent dihydroorotate dehydrogenase [Pseudomonadota bacterium]